MICSANCHQQPIWYARYVRDGADLDIDYLLLAKRWLVTRVSIRNGVCVTPQQPVWLSACGTLLATGPGVWGWPPCFIPADAQPHRLEVALIECNDHEIELDPGWSPSVDPYLRSGSIEGDPRILLMDWKVYGSIPNTNPAHRNADWRLFAFICFIALVLMSCAAGSYYYRHADTVSVDRQAEEIFARRR